jgi:uncharacterized protein
MQERKLPVSDPINVAASLFRAIESRTPEAVAELYRDDVQVWHNFSNACQDKATNLAVLRGLCASSQSIHYDVVERIQLGERRVLQRHVLRVGTPSGEEILIPACIFIEVEDARIIRIDEYLDTAQANRLREATGRPPVGSPNYS